MKVPVELNGKTILVTGCPGFIGAYLVMRLLKELDSGTVISIDSMNDYYEVSLKEWRLSQVEAAAAESRVKHIFLRPDCPASSALSLRRPGVLTSAPLRLL